MKLSFCGMLNMLYGTVYYFGNAKALGSYVHNGVNVDPLKRNKFRILTWHWIGQLSEKAIRSNTWLCAILHLKQNKVKIQKLFQFKSI